MIVSRIHRFVFEENAECWLSLVFEEAKNFRLKLLNRPLYNHDLEKYVKLLRTLYFQGFFM